MTSFSIERLELDADAIAQWARRASRHSNWPVVYTLNNESQIYVGESLSATTRMRQHLVSVEKRSLRAVRVVIGDTFNKSVCLDLESQLIGLFAGDGNFRVLNKNEGITNAEYYGRDEYQALFRSIFDQLRDHELFQQPIEAIQNSDLFKLSPFKALNGDQVAAVRCTLAMLLDELGTETSSNVVIQGDPGTGKTVVAIFLVKLLRDIATLEDGEELDSDSPYADFFTLANRDELRDLRIAFVVPQQSLRASIKKVFTKTARLEGIQIMNAFELAASGETFDLVIVDETHRLNQRANQSSAASNARFRESNVRLFGRDDVCFTQLDCIMHRSCHRLFLVDPAQRVRPADLPLSTLERLVSDAQEEQTYVRLWSQMRVVGGDDYTAYVRAMLSDCPPTPRRFDGYDFRLFDSFLDMWNEILAREAEFGLSRLVAGFAWKWTSKKTPEAYDIALDGFLLRWNSEDKDWISQPRSINEVGSIHTVQGYDLNYAGVVIGPDLRFDPSKQAILFHRESYKDPKGMENNKMLGITYSDADILGYICNIYSVLLTRGIRGTYVYVCDPPLREYLRRFIGPR
jgi:DUF2075 family protein